MIKRRTQDLCNMETLNFFAQYYEIEVLIL